MVEHDITAAPAANRPGAARVAARRVGTSLVALGALAAVYAAVVVLWQDPITGLYAHWRQHQLSAQLAHTFSTYETAHPYLQPVRTPAGRQRTVLPETRQQAAFFAASLTPGQALGRIIIPRLSLNVVFVNGTSWLDDLSRGPGRYPSTSLPGLGRTTAIAGHRTTFGAWFRHIDALQAHDLISLVMPYGTFRYEVTGHKVVSASDWSIVRTRGYDELVLSACHPLYSASHRWIVFARLRSVTPPRGTGYTLSWTA
jgi:sortase A